jgi:hypothetical protein
MKLKKQEIEMYLKEIKKDLETAVADAEKYSAEFSDDIHARRSFECGFLGSRIKHAVWMLNEMEK